MVFFSFFDSSSIFLIKPSFVFTSFILKSETPFMFLSKTFLFATVTKKGEYLSLSLKIITLFAGAGILPESTCDGEWDEIEQKMNSFWKVFDGN